MSTTIPPARWWRTLDEERIICDLCPRECTLREGQRAFCFVRQNVGGEMVLTTYGRSTGFCIDPIEKKPLNHFLPGSPILSFGTAGCNLGCRFCQNWDISKAREVEKLSSVASPKQIALAAKKHHCRAVAFTYNDPVIWAEYAIDTAIACRELGIKTVAVTAGYIKPEARAEFYRYIDAANVDLKAFTEQFYEKITFSSLGSILETLVYLKNETQVWFEITTLLIPGENDSEKEVGQLCDWIFKNLGPEVPLHFTAFHPDFKMLDHPPTPKETLVRARKQALSAGIHYVYTGNVHDTSGSSTYCPSCKKLLIERDWYVLGKYHLVHGKCKFCKTPIPGLFEDVAGTWGAKRQPILI
ncbi:MAG: AmmeMemoRadiSam system radical SAM enzyme [Planctomycetota bacterium]